MMFSKFVMFLFALPFFNADTLEVQSTIDQVTVYQKGALVTRVLELPNIRTSTNILIKELPANIDRNTIEITSKEGLEILSVKNAYYIDTVRVDEDLHARYDKIIAEAEDSILLYRSFNQVLNEEKQLFRINNKLSSEQEVVDMSELKMASELYRERLKQIERELFQHRLKIKTWEKSISETRQKYRYEKYLSGTRVNILTQPNLSGQQSINLKYFVPNAGWNPYYDIRVSDEESSQLRLDLKANVFQNTGESWENVELTLTNSDPTQNKIAPMMTPYYFYQNTDMYAYDKKSGVAMGRVTDASGEPLIGASVVVHGTNFGVITDIDGNFQIPNGKDKKVVISYVGYESKEYLLRSGFQRIVLEEGAALDEVVVRGSRSNQQAYYIDGIRVKEEKEETRKVVSVAKTESVTAVYFQLEDRYTIPSADGYEELFIEQKQVGTSLYYNILPRLSNHAFLMASIESWEDYDLFNAPANIFHNRTYKGKTFINTKSLGDTLEISVGVDPEVIVSREKLKNFTKKNFFKSKTIEEVAWEVKVKNAKKKDIDIRIMDQYPISNDKSIEVDLLRFDEAKVDDKRGFLDWKIQLNSGDQVRKNIIYKVKYPKDRNLVMI